jgi:hypothetical protein
VVSLASLLSRICATAYGFVAVSTSATAAAGKTRFNFESLINAPFYLRADDRTPYPAGIRGITANPSALLSSLNRKTQQLSNEAILRGGKGMQFNYGAIPTHQCMLYVQLHWHSGDSLATQERLGRLDCSLRRSFPKKIHQLSVHFLRVCPGYTVRPVLHYQ